MSDTEENILRCFSAAQMGLIEKRRLENLLNKPQKVLEKFLFFYPDFEMIFLQIYIRKVRRNLIVSPIWVNASGDMEESICAVLYTFHLFLENTLLRAVLSKIINIL